MPEQNMVMCIMILGMDFVLRDGAVIGVFTATFHHIEAGYLSHSQFCIARPGEGAMLDTDEFFSRALDSLYPGSIDQLSNRYISGRHHYGAPENAKYS